MDRWRPSGSPKSSPPARPTSSPCRRSMSGGRGRGGGDQAEEIARLLRLNHHFHPALHLESEQYGDAILTPHRSRVVRAGALPGLVRRPGLEPRGAIWVEVEIGGVV